MHESGSQSGSSLTQRLGAMGHKFLSEVVASLLATGVITAATTIYWHVSAPETTVAAVPVVASTPAPTPAAPAAEPGPQLTASLPGMAVPPRPVARPRVDKRARKPEAEKPVAEAEGPVVQAAAAPAIDEPLFDSGVPAIALVARPAPVRSVQPAADVRQTEPVSKPIMAAAIAPDAPPPAISKTEPQTQESGGPVAMVLGTASNGLKAVQGVGSALLSVIP